ncbi:N-acetyl-gamma-glutamyl-phosphate reductase [Marinoscillum furvescens]|uniref:N-acetyl-gamma-glutamyl-phosphate reductase n=1 Tax=Marinoscillum furvescens DSM 4134 TaxID=1122208 RepID=A0A3D9L5W4_MARFU|nr:N-acetyl-gamma-glutamyl-phosphate reductase [Marinoscillum furvescens]REE00106.1 N-acetyl-gamma-glutamyl-phosphate reductase [Marinoscillum furvescens DSM 4134]
MAKKNIAIVGATGYTGSELVRVLINHPGVNIAAITSESRKGEKFSDVHPQFQGLFEPELVGIDDISEMDLDLVFLALPHGVSMDFVKANHDKAFKIVDLSGDFRLSNKEVYEAWYKKEHNFEAGFEQAVFGAPELFRERIKDARLVANPGCFPTSSILALAPLLKEGLIDKSRIVIDSKTGVTGAGIKAKPNTHYPMVNDNFTAYGIKSHRHTIEIQEIISKYANDEVTVLFTPHLLPVDRGILSTCYSTPVKSVSTEELEKVFEEYYANEPFVRLRNSLPSLKQVRGTNYCDIYVTYDGRTNSIITIGVIDNLMKGAAGQAVQNMNLMLGLNETDGLSIAPIQP